MESWKQHESVTRIHNWLDTYCEHLFQTFVCFRPVYVTGSQASQDYYPYFGLLISGMEILIERRSSVQKDGHPAYFFLCSAQAAIERRKLAQRAAESRGGHTPSPLSETPMPGQFLGQLASPSSQRRLTDDEFVQFLEVGCYLCPYLVAVQANTVNINSHEIHNQQELQLAPIWIRGSAWSVYGDRFIHEEVHQSLQDAVLHTPSCLAPNLNCS